MIFNVLFTVINVVSIIFITIIRINVKVLSHIFTLYPVQQVSLRVLSLCDAAEKKTERTCDVCAHYSMLRELCNADLIVIFTHEFESG